MKYIIVLIFIISTSVYAADFQVISDESKIEAIETAQIIKASLSEAVEHDHKANEAKAMINSNPAAYDTPAIQAEWDEVISELKSGKFCKGCGRTKREFGAGFEAHAASNGGTESAPQSVIDAANNKYEKKVETAQRMNELYEESLALRSSYIFNAEKLRKKLNDKIQVSYDFQLRTYIEIRKITKEVSFKELSDFLLLKNTRVLNSNLSDPSYKDYVYERYQIAEKMDGGLTKLNEKRIKIIENAESKRQLFLKLLLGIREVSSEISDNNVPTGTMIAVGFNYDIRRDYFIGVKPPEKIEGMLNPDVLQLYKKVKNQGY